MSLKGRRALVTGGGGFLGTHLVRGLVEAGADVHVLSRRPSSASAAFPPTAAVSPHIVDLEAIDAVRTVVRGIGATHVFHLAGRVDLDRSLEVGQACVRENVAATLNLLDALEGTLVDTLVYTSTTEVYGGNAPPFREDQAVDPPSPYAVSKVAGEHLCRIHAARQGYRLCVLRLATGYGPGQRAERLVPSTILSCLHGGPVTLHSPDHRRDFIYVGDLVDGILRAATRPLAGCEVINLGSETAVSVAEIAECIMRISGNVVPVVATGRARPNEAPCWTTNADRARRLLEWAPRTPLDEGLLRTVRFYADPVPAGRS